METNNDFKREQILAMNISAELGRLQLARKAGLTFEGARDMFAALGYKQNPVYSDFYAQYDTGEIAQRVIDTYPDETWGAPPEIYDNEDEGVETAFEKAFAQLVKDFKIWGVLNRADKICGIGRYSVILLGLSGGEPPEDEAAGAKKLLYLQPYSEESATIKEYDLEPTSPRYGLPKTYYLRTRAGDTENTLVAHWTRVVHICEGNLENTIFGKPRLRVLFNRLDDITKTVGGGAEMFWRAAFKGLHGDIDPAANPTPEQFDAFKEKLNDYYHGLTRFIGSSGAKITALSGETADPAGLFGVIVQLISCASGIPQRILLGSERGELASSQDTQEWNGRIMRRMETHAGPNMLRPLLDRFIALGILPKPQGGEYEIEWPDLMALKDSERAALGKTLAEGANTLSPGNAEGVITREEWRVSVGMPAIPEGGFDDEVPEEDIPEEDPEAIIPTPEEVPA